MDKENHKENGFLHVICSEPQSFKLVFTDSVFDVMADPSRIYSVVEYQG